MAPEPDLDALSRVQLGWQALRNVFGNLKSLGVGSTPELPRVLVIGEHSASVIEAIMGISWADDDNSGASRLPAEFVFNPDLSDSIRVKTQEENLTYHMNRGRLASKIQATTQRQAIDTHNQIIRVEVPALHNPEFTLISLPVFPSNRTESNENCETGHIDELVNKYMQEESTIYVVALSATDEPAEQHFFREAKKADPDGQRTLGVIIYPTGFREQSSKQEVFQGLTGTGWHALQDNRPEKTPTIKDLDDADTTFFQSPVWSKVSARDRGVNALREKLAGMLFLRILLPLPDLATKIATCISSHENRIKSLDDTKKTSLEVKKHLNKIAFRFQRIAADAIRGHHLEEFFGGLPTNLRDLTWQMRKLHHFVVAANDAFRHCISLKGHRDSGWKPDSDRGDSSSWDTNKFDEPNSHLKAIIDLYDLRNLEGLDIETLRRKFSSQMLTACQNINSPGCPQDQITLDILHETSKHWEALAREHARMAGLLSDDFFGRYFDDKEAQLDAKMIDGSRLVIKRRRDGILVRHADRNIQQDNRSEVLDETITQAGMRESDLMSEQLLDHVSVCYKTSAEFFAQSIVLAIEDCLVRGIPDLLNPEKAFDLNDTELVAFSLPTQTQIEKEALVKELEALRRALPFCNNLKCKLDQTLGKVIPIYFLP
ncbi:hypothetical protein B0T14DRAFT_566820 [Immersiella caudata]|uniref:GED domain-containing protein n=1 Tax=Immersiella caudata TaxID=314043 RepID=A0AA39WR34_9PEZI|nr:hypothetical protein B0T14DRAFT_566820 [Immersiella caudata]